MTREIKPQDVPAMMRSGELEPGTVIESRKCIPGSKVVTCELVGYSKRYDIIYADFNGVVCQCCDARFPLPDLRDGDPVIILPFCTQSHFAEFCEDSNSIKCWPNGWTKWSCKNNYNCLHTYDEWRIPTPQELVEGGYPADYYTSRGIK